MRTVEQIGWWSLKRELPRHGGTQRWLCTPKVGEGPDVLLKLLPPLGPSEIKRFDQDCIRLRSLHSPLLASYISHDAIYFDEQNRQRGYLVLEWTEGDNLGDLIAAPLVPDVVRAVGRSLAEALTVLHREGLQHRNLQPDCVVVDRSGPSWRITLADVGLAEAVASEYAAPETFFTSSPASDVYSLGILLSRLLLGPQHLELGPSSDSFDPGPSVPEPLRAAIQQMTARDPARRPEASKIPALLERSLAPLEPAPSVGPDLPVPPPVPPPAPIPAPPSALASTIRPPEPEPPLARPAMPVPAIFQSPTVTPADLPPPPRPPPERKAEPRSSERPISPWVIGVLLLLFLVLVGAGGVGVYGMKRDVVVKVTVHGADIHSLRLGGQEPDRIQNGQAQFSDVPQGERELVVQAGAGCDSGALQLDVCCESARQQIHIPWGTEPLVIPEITLTPLVCAQTPSKVWMVRVDPGSFTRGSPPEEPERDPDEAAHATILTRPYYLSSFEITQGLWKQVMGANPVEQQDCKIFGNENLIDERLPVICVSWLEAIQFANALSRKDGLSAAYRVQGRNIYWDPAADGYRLPTEAEWEYAARAAGDLRFGLTNDPEKICEYANLADRSAAAQWPQWTTATCADGFSGLAPPGTFQANHFGLYDLQGNIAEWVWDWYAPYPTQSVTDPVGPTSGTERIHRGGAWTSPSARLRVAARSHLPPGEHNIAVGLRLARNGP